MVAKAFALSFAGLLGGAGAAACSPADSCPKLSDGLYCPVNDVTEHGDINRDVALIKEYLAEETPNYSEAKKVYMSGNHSSKGAGVMRTLQDLAQKDMTVGGKYTNTFYSGAVDLYGGKDAVWHNYIMACFEANGVCAGKSDDFRKNVINKGAIGVVTAYVTYETGAGIWKAADGQTTDDGAPYAWDEAAAFYIGNVAPVIGDGYSGKAPGNLYSPYEFNWKRDDDFPEGLSTHVRAIKILNYGLLNLRGTDYKAANVQAAQTAMYKVLSLAAIRSAIKYSWKAYNDGDLSSKYLAEAWAYWRSASGYLSTVNKTKVQEIDSLLDFDLTSMPATTPCRVKEVLESMYADAGVTCAMVGAWKDAPSDSCLASACEDSGSTGTLLEGSEEYVDMCGADASSALGRGPSAAATAAVAAVAAVCDFA